MTADRYTLEIDKSGRPMMRSPYSGCLVRVPDLGPLEDMIERIRARTREAVARFREGRGVLGSSGRALAYRNAWTEYRGAIAYVADIRRVHQELSAKREA